MLIDVLVQDPVKLAPSVRVLYKLRSGNRDREKIRSSFTVLKHVLIRYGKGLLGRLGLQNKS